MTDLFVKDLWYIVFPLKLSRHEDWKISKKKGLKDFRKRSFKNILFLVFMNPTLKKKLLKKDFLYSWLTKKNQKWRWGGGGGVYLNDTRKVKKSHNILAFRMIRFKILLVKDRNKFFKTKPKFPYDPYLSFSRKWKWKRKRKRISLRW